MTLPPLALQVLYAHLAWGCFLAGFTVVMLGYWRTLERWQVVAVAAIAFAVCSPIGTYSASYWLGLCFQWPSPFLALCAALVVWRRGRGLAHLPLMPTPLAGVVAAVGLVLYMDSVGWLPLGLYARGFGPGAAVTGLVGGTLALVAVFRRVRRDLAMAVLLSLTLFAVWRLPTGNVWDAVLDPLMWFWAVGCLVRRGVLAARRRRPVALSPSPLVSDA
jgi:hypothetical protein